MAKNEERISIVPMLYSRWKDSFAEMEWSKGLMQTFEVGQLLEAVKAEAGAKGMGVIVQVALCPLEWFYGPVEPTSADTHTEGETQHEQE